LTRQAGQKVILLDGCIVSPQNCSFQFSVSKSDLLVRRGQGLNHLIETFSQKLHLIARAADLNERQLAILNGGNSFAEPAERASQHARCKLCDRSSNQDDDDHEKHGPAGVERFCAQVVGEDHRHYPKYQRCGEKEELSGQWTESSSSSADASHTLPSSERNSDNTQKLPYAAQVPEAQAGVE